MAGRRHGGVLHHQHHTQVSNVLHYSVVAAIVGDGDFSNPFHLLELSFHTLSAFD